MDHFDFKSDYTVFKLNVPNKSEIPLEILVQRYDKYIHCYNKWTQINPEKY